MDIITVSALTLDEAITKALIDLETTSDHLHYEIIDEGSKGFFGIFGVKPLVIRARIKSEEEEKKDKKIAELADEIFMKSTTSVLNEDKELMKEKPIRQSIHKKRPEKDNALEHGTRFSVDEELIQKKAKDFLFQVFDAMKIEAVIDTSISTEERELQVTLSGSDMGILIGKRGQTLDSLQYLVSLVVNKEAEGYLRVKLDTDNYRERRKETLEVLAKNIAYKVKRTKKPISLEPMNPYERRIIHYALQNDKLINTRSEGEDPFRHVVVSLKRENHRNKNHSEPGYK